MVRYPRHSKFEEQDIKQFPYNPVCARKISERTHLKLHLVTGVAGSVLCGYSTQMVVISLDTCTF